MNFLLLVHWFQVLRLSSLFIRGSYGLTIGANIAAPISQQKVNWKIHPVSLFFTANFEYSVFIDNFIQKYSYQRKLGDCMRRSILSLSDTWNISRVEHLQYAADDPLSGKKKPNALQTPN